VEQQFQSSIQVIYFMKSSNEDDLEYISYWYLNHFSTQNWLGYRFHGLEAAVFV
jgi:hypothetical protein